MVKDNTNECPTNKVFVKILIAIIFGWILINLWTTVVETIAYKSLGLSKNSWLHTLLVAVVVTILFLIYVHCVEEKATIRTKMTGALLSTADTALSMTD
jgi:ABC-type transport system involved in Fe-S cluster assembly fused permease/ATPase subunit